MLKLAWPRLLGVLLLSLLLQVLPARAADPAPFRFAWLSDTHVGSLTGEEDLRATVRELNSITGLSFVVLSGDVTEYGSREQFQLAKQLLDGLNIPAYVLPGNHDTKWSESGATDFARFWKQDRFLFEHRGLRFLGLHQGPLMKMGDGHWAPQDVRWLRDTLAGLEEKDTPLIFVTHYPIDNGIANWYVVLDLLKQHNVQAVLCGHVHRNSVADFEGIPGVTGRANVRGNAARGGFTIVAVQNSTLSCSEHPVGGPPLAPWHTLSLHRRNHSLNTNAYPRPDFSVNARYPKVKAQWRVNTGYTIASTPAVWKELAIIGDASGAVRALTLDSGKQQWLFKTGGPVYSSPETSGNLVVLASADGQVYALNAATGQERWRYRTSRPIVASPRVHQGVVYLGSSEGKFRALQLASGKLLWEFKGLGGFVETKPLVHGGKVFFGAWDEYFYALEAKSGKLVWKWKSDRPGILFSPAACWPVATGERVFIAAPDRKLSALHCETGSELWRSGAYPVRESIGISEDGKRLYARSIQDSILAFSTSAPGAQKLWEIDGGFGYDINSAMLVEKGGVVFYGTKNGLVMALEASSGAIQWQHKIGVGVVNTLMPLSPKRVLATDFDGKVVLLTAGG